MGLHCEAGMDRKFTFMMNQINFYLDRFPENEQECLVRIIKNTMYEMYGCFTEAQLLQKYKYNIKPILNTLDTKNHKLKMYIRYANERGYFARQEDGRKMQKESSRRFACVQGMVDELGKMIGGWIAYNKSHNLTKQVVSLKTISL